MTSPISSHFHLFPALPTELRLKIFVFTRWHQPPRIIEASHLPSHTYPSVVAVPFLQNSPSGPQYPEAHTQWHTVTPSSRRFPPVWHVSREARAEMLRCFTWLRMGVWFDYERNYLYFGEETAAPDIRSVLTLGLRANGESTQENDLDIGKIRYMAMIDA